MIDNIFLQKSEIARNKIFENVGISFFLAGYLKLPRSQTSTKNNYMTIYINKIQVGNILQNKFYYPPWQ